MNKSYGIKSFNKLENLPGLSEPLLKNHLTLYEGYVKNANKLIEASFSLLNSGETETPVFAELRRRLGWELNGLKLHEYYFENLAGGGETLDKNSELFKKIEESFGSFLAWETDFKAVGKMRGIGWAILYYDKEGGRLFNAWITEHDAGHFSGLIPLLVMDVFEHAYMPDYGLKKADYIEAFFRNINWKKVEERFLEE